MYSQFCYYIQRGETKRYATMHVPRDPGKQTEVDWAGDKAEVVDRYSGEVFKAHTFVGAMSYNAYAYAEAFSDEKEPSRIKANIRRLGHFGGVPRIIVPDNTSTAIILDRKWTERHVNKAYQEFPEHYGTAIIPVRVRHPRDYQRKSVVGNWWKPPAQNAPFAI